MRANLARMADMERGGVSVGEERIAVRKSYAGRSHVEAMTFAETKSCAIERTS